MSDEQPQHEIDLARAIEAYAAALGVPMVTGWVVAVCGTSLENLDNGKTRYLTAAEDSMPFHSALGLAAFLVNDIEDSQGDDDD